MGSLTYVDGTTHQTPSFDGLGHDEVQIFRNILSEVEHFRETASEILHRFAARAAYQTLVRTVQPVQQHSKR